MEDSASNFNRVLGSHRWDVVWLLALAAYTLAGMALNPFHGDESTQIFMSHDYTYQFLQRDLSRMVYSEIPVSPNQQHLRLLNGSINKYLIGLSWHLAGITPEEVNTDWDWGAAWDYNIAAGHMPLPELLLAGRLSSTLFTAGGAVVVFVLGWLLGGRLTAYLASAYYALNPAVLLNGRRATMEGSLLFFSLLTVLAGIWFLRERSWRAAALLGVVSGLAIASKHNAAFTVISVLMACGLYLLVDAVRGRSNIIQLLLANIGQLALAALLAFAVFYALNPVWWGDPLRRIGLVYETRTTLLSSQVEWSSRYANVAQQVAGFFRQVLVVLPQYYEVPIWQEYVGEQIARYEASPWRGVSIGGSLAGTAVLLELLALGAWELWRRRRDREDSIFVIGIWALAMVLSTLLLTPLEWQRYYVPLYPAIGLLAGLGLTGLVEAVQRGLQQRRERVTISP